MSDQTQDSSSETVAGSAEPSMEDILASIRRIIAEDDDATVLDTDTVSETQTSESQTEIDDAELLELEDVLNAEAESFDVDDLAIPEAETIISEPESSDLDLSFDAMMSESDDLAMDIDLDITEAVDSISLDNDPVIEVETSAADEKADVIDLLNISDEPAAPSVDDEFSVFDSLDLTLDENPEPAAENTDLDFDSLLDELELDNLAEPAEPVMDSHVDTHVDVIDAENMSPMDTLTDDLVADLLGSDAEPEPLDELPDVLELDTPEPERAEISLDEFLTVDDEPVIAQSEPETPIAPADDADIDLVKSLMADLTDDSFLDSEDAGPEIDMVLDDASKFVEATDEASDEQDAVLDDILQLAMDDEIAVSQVLDDPFATADLTESVAGPVIEDTRPNVLLDIAAAAEADAEWVQVKLQDSDAEADETDADDGLSIPEVEAVSTDDIIDELMDFAEDNPVEEPSEELMAEIEESLAVAEDELDTHNMKEEVADMPKAAATDDTILDEITETAASDAFAELNQVVEEKTAARAAGPHIGDLVQEALKPMLKEWLDENLKDIVERAVQKEVKRISTRK